jgi:hypothetical protein
MAFADKSRKKLREATSAVRESLAGTVETAKQKVSSSGLDRDDNLGPDRGTMDQLEARKERARMEAREEAKKEARQEQLQEVREQEKQEAKQDFAKESTSTLKRLGEALTTDYDGDGESLAGEVGLQTEKATRRDNKQTAQAITDTRQAVAANQSMLEQVREDMQQAHSRSQQGFEPMGAAPDSDRAGPPPMDPGPGMVPTPEEFREQAETPASGGGFGYPPADEKR